MYFEINFYIKIPFLPALLPSSLLPLVVSPLVLLPFLRSSCSCLSCPSSYGVFSYYSPSFGGFGLLHLHACSSTSACSCLCSLWVHCTSALPSSGVSVGLGGCIRWVLHRYYLRLLLVFLLFFLPRLFYLCLLLQFFLPLFLLPGLRGSRGSILLPLLSCLRHPGRGLSLLLLAWALLHWFLWLLVSLRCLYLALRCFQRSRVFRDLCSFSFALLLLAPLRVSLALPLLRLAPRGVSLALLLSLALLRLILRCLGLLQLLPSSSLSVWLRSYCPFAPGLLLQSLPVLRLRFLRLSFLTFDCFRLHWCLAYISIGIWLLSSRWLQVLRRLLFLLALFSWSSSCSFCS